MVEAPSYVVYQKSGNVWSEFVPFLKDLIDKHGFRKICDIGGGANPILDIDFVRDRNLEYTVLDISEEELSKAPEGYKKVHADICSPDFSVSEAYELAFSRMLAEHIVMPEQFHRNILKSLVPNGFAVHCFPTLYALPFFANWILPDSLARTVLRIVAPRNAYRYGKFPAYYRWCRGPTKGQIRRLRELGYEIVEYRAFFGHREYYRRLDFLRILHEIKTDFLVRHPNPYLTSFAYVTLKKSVSA